MAGYFCYSFFSPSHSVLQWNKIGLSRKECIYMLYLGVSKLMWVFLRSRNSFFKVEFFICITIKLIFDLHGCQNSKKKQYHYYTHHWQHHSVYFKVSTYIIHPLSQQHWSTHYNNSYSSCTANNTSRSLPCNMRGGGKQAGVGNEQIRCVSKSWSVVRS